MFPIHQCRVHALVGTASDVRAHFSTAVQSNDTSHTQSNGSPAQSNGLGAAPGDLRLTIFYSPNPEPSLDTRSSSRHRAGEGGLAEWIEPEPEPAVMCLGYAIVPLNQYVMKWSQDGTSLRSGIITLSTHHIMHLSIHPIITSLLFQRINLLPPTYAPHQV